MAPLDLGTRRELFVDHLLIESLRGAALRLQEPRGAGSAITLDSPWEGHANYGLAALHHGGRYYLYYRALKIEEGTSSALCVAVSDDGVQWSKPDLGLVRWEGGIGTNLVADPDGQTLMATPWLDNRPGTPENERFKATTSEPVCGEAHTEYIDPGGPKRLAMWVSADGFTFRRMSPQPDIISELVNAFDGGNTLFWSEVEQLYVLYYRFWDGMRTIARTVSTDLMHWSPPVPMEYGDTPREHLYTNNTFPYPRAPHIYIAPSARFMPERRVVTDEQAEQIGLKGSRGHNYYDDCSDAALLTTRAGSTTYDRTFMETFVRPGPGAGNWVSRTNYPLTGFLPVGDTEMAMFVNRLYMQDGWHVERLLLRVDGFASVNAPYAGGEMVTRPITFAGDRLEINYRTGAAGSVRVEMLDAGGAPIEGFAAHQCPEIVGDEIARIVAWDGGPDLAPLRGGAVRMRFAMRDADLFALQFPQAG